MNAMNFGPWLKKNRRKLSVMAQLGLKKIMVDAWIYTCIKRNTYFFVAFSVGKWTQKTCKSMIEQLFNRTKLPFPNNKMEVFTDGNDDYTHCPTRGIMLILVSIMVNS